MKHDQSFINPTRQINDAGKSGFPLYITGFILSKYVTDGKQLWYSTKSCCDT